MSNELRARLIATPAVKLSTIGLGEHSHDAGLKILQSLAQRRTWIRQGFAMMDGSFPIPNVSHLKYALEAYEFAENRRRTQRWIVRRAKTLGRIDLLPPAWQPKPILAAGEESEDQTGCMIAIYPPPELAEILAGPKATDEPAEELHVTLAFLGDMSQFDGTQIAGLVAAMASAIEGTDPLEANIQGFGVFTNGKDNGDPVWYSVNCVGLSALRAKLVDILANQGGFELADDFDFVPHMTVRYGMPMLTALPNGGDKKWPVDSVYLVMGGNRLPIPFVQAEETPLPTSPDPTMEETPPQPSDELTAEVAEFAKHNNSLKEYWTVGEGRAKWDSWTELYHHIRKHVEPEYAKRIAAQWFHDVKGFWPGDKRNR